MAGTAAPVRKLAGHNRISTQALTSLAQAAAAEHFGVTAPEIRVAWSDDRGLLALSLGAPIRIPRLSSVVRDPRQVDRFGGTVWDRAVAAKAIILDRVSVLSGAQLSRVDIRITGARVEEGRRVR